MNINTISKKLLLPLILSFAASGFAQYKLYQDGLEKYNEKDFYGAIEKFSDFLTRPIRDKKFDVDAYYWRGLSAFKLGDFAAAAEDLKQSLNLKHNNTGNIHWFLAKCYDNLNQHNDAISEYTLAIKILKHDNKQKEAQLLTERAAVYAKLGNTSSAMADLHAALAIEPHNESIKNSIAHLSDSKVQQVENKSVPTNTPVVAQNEKKKDEPQNPNPQPIRQTQVEAVKPDVKTEVKQEPLRSEQQVAVVQQQNVSQPAEPREPTLEELYGDEKRFALVIGNSAYSKEIGVLKNPVNDATDFAAALKSMNFDVTLITDASYGKIRAEMMKFRDKLNSGERDKTVGLFYYAGHGLQYDNENYIVPVDAEITFEDDIVRYCFPIQKMVLSQMEMTNSRMNIVILDACRNNPFPAIHRSIGESAGLGEMKKARGAFIAYATSPGSVASDGIGRNGLYTQELIKAMSKPGRTIEQVFKEVRANVMRQSGGKQNPWENSNIIGDFYFRLK
ncbi:MAG: caspase family protein [Cyclobacteriaceae bacterium]|nr:caspase family protein [Cyclobacteriaceae bacterium]